MACVFCNLANKVWDTNIVYEDDDFVALLDLSQLTKGHTLVMPKKHIENLLFSDDETLSKILIVAKKVSKAVMKAFGASGVNIINNCGEMAGQTVMHLHIHIIPRYENDSFGFTEVTHEGEYDLNAIKEEIIKNI